MCMLVGASALVNICLCVHICDGVLVQIDACWCFYTYGCVYLYACVFMHAILGCMLVSICQ